jgi:ADP-ribose pyrophosphatase YjhB (NUDIX family)
MAPLIVAAAAALFVFAVVLAIAGVLGRRRAGTGKWVSAGGVVMDARGRVALIRQRNRRGRWRWTLPKGRIDPGETAEAAALREVFEESGLRASVVRPIGMHEGRFHFTYFFEMTLERQEAEPERATREVRLVSLTEAADMLRSRRDLRVLRRLIEMRTGVASFSAAAREAR